MNEDIVFEGENGSDFELLSRVSESADRDLRRYASRFNDENLI